MREIKFRAWDKVFKLMIFTLPEGYEMDLEGDILTCKDEESSIVQSLTFELMQYTGLKDKNGKEIYSGDILGLPETPMHLFGKPHIVRKSDSGEWVACYNDIFNFATKEWVKADEESCSSLLNGLRDAAYGRDKWEVIGNIYEHGDLLNEKP